VVAGWGSIGGEVNTEGEWMRRGKSSWQGEKWIVVQEKEGQGRE
jgi:hypothetical protein